MKKCNYMLRAATAVRGNSNAPGLHGCVWFCDISYGVHVRAKIFCLPKNDTGFYGFHLHETGDCSLPDFSGAGGHYNPGGLEHPLHAGDFPMLIADNRMQAELIFVTSRFRVEDILGRAVIIHLGRDDYTSQPSGDAGTRIGCGIIRAL